MSTSAECLTQGWSTEGAWNWEETPGASNLLVMFYFLSWWWVLFVSLYLHSICPNVKKSYEMFSFGNSDLKTMMGELRWTFPVI